MDGLVQNGGMLISIFHNELFLVDISAVSLMLATATPFGQAHCCSYKLLLKCFH